MANKAQTTSEESETTRCAECDREMKHVIVFTGPTNDTRAVCWQCLEREEKGFNAKRDFRRSSRHGYIPR
jgi:hypothetical protein